MRLAYIVLSSKSEDLCNHVFYNIINVIKNHTNMKSFNGIKIMSDFEIGLPRSIKKIF